MAALNSMAHQQVGEDLRQGTRRTGQWGCDQHHPKVERHHVEAIKRVRTRTRTSKKLTSSVGRTSATIPGSAVKETRTGPRIVTTWGSHVTSRRRGRISRPIRAPSSAPSPISRPASGRLKSI